MYLIPRNSAMAYSSALSKALNIVLIVLSFSTTCLSMFTPINVHVFICPHSYSMVVCVLVWFTLFLVSYCIVKMLLVTFLYHLPATVLHFTEDGSCVATKLSESLSQNTLASVLA